MPNPGINRETAGRPGGALNRYTKDWLNRIAAAGGAAPSQATIRVMNQFGRNLIKANIDSGFVYLCVYVPDNLIASITPYIKTAGNDSCVNHNFVAADLTINGLIGNGTTKFLDTGCIPLTCFPSDASAGNGCYISNIPAAESKAEGGQQGNGGTSAIEIYANFNGLAEFDCWTGGSTAIGAMPSNTTSGYVFGSLIAGVNTIFFANAANPHASIATHAAAGGRSGVFSYYFFASNSLGTAAVLSGKRLSASFITISMTAVESSAFFTALDNCRRGLGGGFV